MMTNKEKLKDSIDNAIKQDAKYIFVEVYAEGSPASEIIINPIENAETKLEYYMRAYDNELKLPHAPISIISFGCVNDLSQLEYERINGEVIR